MKIHNDLDKIDILNRVAEMERARYSSSGDLLSYQLDRSTEGGAVKEETQRHRATH
jgi:hypothetical protein